MNQKFPELFSTQADDIHLQAAMDWLARAQNISGCGGVLAHYNIKEQKWGLAYPETTGYIISTFLLYSKSTNDKTYLDRAVRMGDWEIEIQLDNGGCLAGDITYKYPRVFNTGQIIEGWCELYKETGIQKYLNAAIRAGDWIVKMQDEDGKWTNCSYDGPKVYHSRVAWPLMNLYSLTHDGEYRESASKFVCWALTQQKNNGWFEKMCAINPIRPNMHFIAYTLEGLLETSMLLEDDGLYKNVLNISSLLKNKFIESSKSPDVPPYGFLPVTFDENWESNEHSSCLTGDMQISIVWLKLFEKTGDETYLEAAKRLIERVKQTQDLTSVDPNIHGGIAGSHPVWGVYGSNMILNWATNFFAHAILLKKKFASGK